MCHNLFAQFWNWMVLWGHIWQISDSDRIPIKSSLLLSYSIWLNSRRFFRECFVFFVSVWLFKIGDYLESRKVLSNCVINNSDAHRMALKVLNLKLTEFISVDWTTNRRVVCLLVNQLWLVAFLALWSNVFRSCSSKQTHLHRLSSCHQCNQWWFTSHWRLRNNSLNRNIPSFKM